MNSTKVILAIVVAAVALMLTAFFVDSRKASQKAHLAPPAPAQSTKRDPMVTEKKQAPLRTAEAPHYRPPPVSEDVRRKADAVIRRHAGMSREQKMQSKELMGFMDRTIALLNTPEMMEKVQKAVADVLAVTGVEPKEMNLEFFDKLDDARGRAWVEAAVSEDPHQMEEWLINRLNGSIFEFAVDPSLKKSTEGLSIKPEKIDAEPALPKTEQ